MTLTALFLTPQRTELKWNWVVRIEKRKYVGLIRHFFIKLVWLFCRQLYYLTWMWKITWNCCIADQILIVEFVICASVVAMVFKCVKISNIFCTFEETDKWSYWKGIQKRFLRSEIIHKHLTTFIFHKFFKCIVIDEEGRIIINLANRIWLVSKLNFWIIRTTVDSDQPTTSCVSGIVKRVLEWNHMWDN